MGLHRLTRRQRLPIGMDEAWAFFSDPRNLAVLTPPSMGFRMLPDPVTGVSGEGAPSTVSSGLVVRYRFRPLPVMPVTWVAEFTHVQPRALFVDTQRAGPYRAWHHQHRFRAIEGGPGAEVGIDAGVEVSDTVHYDVGFGLLGDLVNALLVRPRLRAVFEFRRDALEARFGAMPPAVEG